MRTHTRDRPKADLSDAMKMHLYADVFTASRVRGKEGELNACAGAGAVAANPRNFNLRRVKAKNPGRLAS